MDKVAHLYRWYAGTMLAVFALIVSFVASAFYAPDLPMLGDHHIGDFVFWLMGLVLIASMVFLWRLAEALGRSGAAWVFCSVFFAPIGLIVAFAVMLVVVNSAKDQKPL